MDDSPLTASQAWALAYVKAHPRCSPSDLGEHMSQRPGLVLTGGNQFSRQGCGRMGGTMIERLIKMGLVVNSDPRAWSARPVITSSGVAALQRSTPAMKGKTNE